MIHVTELRRIVRASLPLGCVILMVGMTNAEAPVADAAMHGDIEAVRSLLRSGADVNAAQGDGMTALHWAAQAGDRQLAEILVYAGARLEAGTRIGRYTALHIAAREGRHEVARVLVEAGADPEATTSNSGVTPLHLAARSGDAGLISLLIEHGADPDAKAGKWQQPPLTFAAALNRVDAIETLLGAGADPNGTSAAIDVVEMAAADNAAEQRLQRALEEFREQQAGGSDWQPTPNQVQAAVDLARQVQSRWTEISAEEEAAADSVTAADSEDESEKAEDEAQIENDAAESNPETSEQDAEVSTAKEDAEVENAEEESRPMSYAEQVGSWGGLSPLHHAVRQGHMEASTALLSGGAEINVVTGDNTTPLLMAAINGQWDVAKLLLDLGADPNLSSDAGATPLYAVLEREWQPRASYAHPTEHQRQKTTHLEMMELFLEAGADPDARLTKHLWYMEYTFGVLRGSGINLEGATPFWRAAYALDLEAMKLLSSYGADPDIRTIKPPQRRRRAMSTEEESEEVESGQEPEALEGNSELDSEEAPSTESEDEVAVEDESEADKGKEIDDSGLPPIPTGGPAIHAIHAASGVGYGQSFAGNAHRYLPNGWLPAVKYLVEEMGADVNARDANGYAPLHHAASRGDVEMILYMVEKGADVMVVSRKGETTVDMANGPVQRVQPYPEAIALLESLGAVNNHNCVSCQ
ncbi:MAG TPA: hypothetical protein DCS75_04525 [Gemmatimonadetes bacterium]|nr:hypothetical protein [Gemmatimonadota bacterium]